MHFVLLKFLKIQLINGYISIETKRMPVTASQEPLNKLAFQLHYIQKMVSQKIVNKHGIASVSELSQSDIQSKRL